MIASFGEQVVAVVVVVGCGGLRSRSHSLCLSLSVSRLCLCVCSIVACVDGPHVILNVAYGINLVFLAGFIQAVSVGVQPARVWPHATGAQLNDARRQ